jgi:hypothetical protein
VGLSAAVFPFCLPSARVPATAPVAVSPSHNRVAVNLVGRLLLLPKLATLRRRLALQQRHGSAPPPAESPVFFSAACVFCCRRKIASSRSAGLSSLDHTKPLLRVPLLRDSSAERGLGFFLHCSAPRSDLLLGLRVPGCCKTLLFWPTAQCLAIIIAMGL